MKIRMDLLVTHLKGMAKYTRMSESYIIGYVETQDESEPWKIIHRTWDWPVVMQS